MFSFAWQAFLIRINGAGEAAVPNVSGSKFNGTRCDPERNPLAHLRA